jgi:hypothetical protein
MPVPSSAKVAKIRRRRRRAGLWSAAGTVFLGTLLYLSVACMIVGLRHQHGMSLVRRADLAITPADGIAVVAALVAVVLSVNLTLAVLNRPDDPVEQVLVTDWQLAMGLVSLFCASLSVMAVLMCWFSSERSHSWGAVIGATALALIAVSLAALIWVRASAYMYAKVEMFRLRRRRAMLVQALEQFQRDHPHRSRSLIRAITGSLPAVLVTALISTTIAHLVALADHQSDSSHAFIELVLIAVCFQAPLLLSGCHCWLLPYAEGAVDWIGDAIWFGLIGAAELAMVVGVTVSSPRQVLPLVAAYGCCLLLVPIALLTVDRRLGRFG